MHFLQLVRDLGLSERLTCLFSWWQIFRLEPNFGESDTTQDEAQQILKDEVSREERTQNLRRLDTMFSTKKTITKVFSTRIITINTRSPFDTALVFEKNVFLISGVCLFLRIFFLDQLIIRKLFDLGIYIPNSCVCLV